jgi:hypothetical protein
MDAESEFIRFNADLLDPDLIREVPGLREDVMASVAEPFPWTGFRRM